ncbi:glycosyltransferase family 39 protein [Methanospirillum lacunae]|uniref:glycosyltransferase family 39 protein n=1 Tax=Methanospirillum lacunae TaxID=668570 RepID=UPI0015E8584F|nr:glycosyltransferase family 39 protein [Methanospirillum lacunae]
MTPTDASHYVEIAVHLTQGEIFQSGGFPFGFPALLALSILIMGPGSFSLQFPIIICLVLCLLVLYLIAKKKIGVLNSLILVFLVGFSPYLLIYKGWVMSEIPFTLVFLFFVFLLDRNYNPYNHTANPFENICIGISVGIGCMIRSVGYVLIPILLITQLIHLFIENDYSKKKLFSLFTPYFVFALIYIPYLIIFRFWGQKYTSHTYGWWQWVYANISGYATCLTVYFPGGNYYWINSLFYTLFVCFLLYSLSVFFRKEYPIIISFFIYLIVITLWPFDQRERFILPVFPIFIYLAIRGIDHIQEVISRCFDHGNLRSRLSKVILPVICVIFIFATLYCDIPLFVNQYHIFGEHQAIIQRDEGNDIFRPYGYLNSLDTNESMELFHYIKGNMEKTSTIAFQFNGYLMMYVGKFTPCGYPITSSRDVELIPIAQKCHSDFIIIHNIDEDAIKILNSDTRYHRVFLNTIYSVYSHNILNSTDNSN